MSDDKLYIGDPVKTPDSHYGIVVGFDDSGRDTEVRVGDWTGWYYRVELTRV